MGIISNFLDSRAVRNAVQQQKNDGFKSNNLWIQQEMNPYDLFYGGTNKAGKYDNFYGDANKLVTGAAKYPFYYSIDNEIADDMAKDTFAYYIKRPNDSYPQRKVLEQIYTELITHGYSDLFIWRKNGKNDTYYFDNKLYDENDFRGITLVSGYDQTKFNKIDYNNITRITYGASQANVFMGYSPTQAANAWRKMQDEMGLHMTAFAKNAGMPIGQWIITAESPEQYVAIKNKLEKKVTGAKNNGKMLFSYQPSNSKEVQIKWVQFTSQDVQDYTKQLEFAEKKMTQSFGVPGTIKGTNDGENYATANVSKRNFVEWSIEPLVKTLLEQLQFQLEKRFTLTGEIKADVELPELADESLVKIQSTAAQVALFDQKIAEGYTPESIVAAYDLPERFLLLEMTTNSSNSTNSQQKAAKHVKNHVHDSKRDEFARRYQNTLTDAERVKLEQSFSSIITEYADDILKNGISDLAKQDFETKMVATFGDNYQAIYNKTLDDVAEALTDLLEVVDVSSLELTDEELLAAKEQYQTRVQAFSTSFAEQIDALEGETLDIRSKAAEPHIKMTTVTESEHSRIVSELKSWTKSQDEFPVRVFKTWNALPDACPTCKDLEDTVIDVTALFIDNPSNEIYEVQGGGAHPSCRCWVEYKMEATE